MIFFLITQVLAESLCKECKTWLDCSKDICLFNINYKEQYYSYEIPNLNHKIDDIYEKSCVKDYCYHYPMLAEDLVVFTGPQKLYDVFTLWDKETFKNYSPTLQDKDTKNSELAKELSEKLHKNIETKEIEEENLRKKIDTVPPTYEINKPDEGEKILEEPSVISKEPSPEQSKIENKNTLQQKREIISPDENHYRRCKPKRMK